MTDLNLKQYLDDLKNRLSKAHHIKPGEMFFDLNLCQVIVKDDVPLLISIAEKMLA